ncbi:hypothetical protein EV715DRAFT_267790 [Schizophyllum commune]
MCVTVATAVSQIPMDLYFWNVTMKVGICDYLKILHLFGVAKLDDDDVLDVRCAALLSGHFAMCRDYNVIISGCFIWQTRPGHRITCSRAIKEILGSDSDGAHDMERHLRHHFPLLVDPVSRPTPVGSRAQAPPGVFPLRLGVRSICSNCEVDTAFRLRSRWSCPNCHHVNLSEAMPVWSWVSERQHWLLPGYQDPAVALLSSPVVHSSSALDVPAMAARAGLAQVPEHWTQLKTAICMPSPFSALALSSLSSRTGTGIPGIDSHATRHVDVAFGPGLKQELTKYFGRINNRLQEVHPQKQLAMPLLSTRIRGKAAKHLSQALVITFNMLLGLSGWTEKQRRDLYTRPFDQFLRPTPDGYVTLSDVVGAVVQGCNHKRAAVNASITDLLEMSCILLCIGQPDTASPGAPARDQIQWRTANSGPDGRVHPGVANTVQPAVVQPAVVHGDAGSEAVTGSWEQLSSKHHANEAQFVCPEDDGIDKFYASALRDGSWATHQNNTDVESLGQMHSELVSDACAKLQSSKADSVHKENVLPLGQAFLQRFYVAFVACVPYWIKPQQLISLRWAAGEKDVIFGPKGHLMFVLRPMETAFRSKGAEIRLLPRALSEALTLYLVLFRPMEIKAALDGAHRAALSTHLFVPGQRNSSRKSWTTTYRDGAFNQALVTVSALQAHDVVVRPAALLSRHVWRHSICPDGSSGMASVLDIQGQHTAGTAARSYAVNHIAQLAGFAIRNLGESLVMCDTAQGSPLSGLLPSRSYNAASPITVTDEDIDHLILSHHSFALRRAAVDCSGQYRELGSRYARSMYALENVYSLSFLLAVEGMDIKLLDDFSCVVNVARDLYYGPEYRGSRKTAEAIGRTNFLYLFAAAVQTTRQSHFMWREGDLQESRGLELGLKPWCDDFVDLRHDIERWPEEQWTKIASAWDRPITALSRALALELDGGKVAEDLKEAAPKKAARDVAEPPAASDGPVPNVAVAASVAASSDGDDSLSDDIRKPPRKRARATRTVAAASPPGDTVVIKRHI